MSIDDFAKDPAGGAELDDHIVVLPRDNVDIRAAKPRKVNSRGWVTLETGADLPAAHRHPFEFEVAVRVRAHQGNASRHESIGCWAAILILHAPVDASDVFERDAGKYGLPERRRNIMADALASAVKSNRHKIITTERYVLCLPIALFIRVNNAHNLRDLAFARVLSDKHARIRVRSQVIGLEDAAAQTPERFGIRRQGNDQAYALAGCVEQASHGARALVGRGHIHRVHAQRHAKEGKLTIGVAVEPPSFFSRVGIGEEIDGCIRNGGLPVCRDDHSHDRATPTEPQRDRHLLAFADGTNTDKVVHDGTIQALSLGDGLWQAGGGEHAE